MSCLFVCLSVSNFVQNLLFRFLWKCYQRYVSEQGRRNWLNFVHIWIWVWEFIEEFFNIARWGIFCSLAHTSRNTDQSFVKISSQMCLWKSSLNLGSHLDLNSRSGFRIGLDSHWHRSALSQVLLFGLSVAFFVVDFRSTGETAWCLLLMVGSGVAESYRSTWLDSSGLSSDVQMWRQLASVLLCLISFILILFYLI